MTTSINTILKNRKNRKNKKGFSLVELIVVLVIMAILAAALVPTLIGYIKQTREGNATNEAAMCVQAAQTIASGAFASAKGEYDVNGVTLKLTDDIKTTTEKYKTAITYLSETKGTLDSVTVDNTCKVTNLVYITENKITVTYNNGVYTCS